MAIFSQKPPSKADLRVKEQYWREYDEAKKEGTSFFPDHVAKDAVMSLIAVLVVLGLAIFAGAPLADKADPAVQVYSPRPEWYFFFLFELLHYFTSASTVILGTIILPTVFFLILFAVPFIDRSRERRPWKRPFATGAGIVTLAVVILLSVKGGSHPDAVAAGDIPGFETAKPQQQNGYALFKSNGCTACHSAATETAGIGPGLGQYGAKKGIGGNDQRFGQLEAYIKNPAQFGVQAMPAFNLPPQDLSDLAAFVKGLGVDYNKGP